MPPTPVPPQQPPDEERPGTLLESDEEIREAQKALKPGPAATAAKQPPSRRPPANPYRPTVRPPMALLTVFDDGITEGQMIRVRGDRFIIGRSEGDLLISHDELISGRHVEITRHRLGDKYRWVITDLQTRNGLFVRVSRTALTDKSEFLVGSGRYRFEAADSELPGTVDFLPAEAKPSSTRHYGSGQTPVRQPVVVELVAGGIGARVPLVQPEHWIGSDPACTICRADDPFVEPRHVRLSCASDNVWHAQNNKTANGLWFKVPQITVEDGCLFQIGEQRFRLKVGG